MKQSKLFMPTLRETPSEVEAISHNLLLRAGYVRQLAAGLYIYLPLGLKVLEKVNAIIREEMNAIGAQEVSMPVLHPAEIWRDTGRWDEIGDEMFRLKDRGDRDMCLGMTHEEIMTWLASREVRSWRDLPQCWYQLQTKLRDEARPKGGILRTREFVMKDSYSFDRDQEGLQKNYDLHAEAYKKIYSRAGLEFYMVDSDPGMMGGAQAHEFMAPSPAGEDEIAICTKCGYAANVELAISKLPELPPLQMQHEEVHTPEKRTIDEVARFLKTDTNRFIKSLLLVKADKKPVLALVRGDQLLHARKLEVLIGPFRPAEKEEVINTLGVEAGFIGPMGHDIEIIADITLKTGVYITGANKKDYHIKGISPGEHFTARFEDIRMVNAEEQCANCSTPLKIIRVIEIGNIFKLGTKYSKPLKATFLDEDGRENPIIMGSYGIGPARVAAAAVEQNNDKDGIIWPKAIAPFDLHILPLNISHEQSMELAGMFHDELTDYGFDILLDDRDERAGVKFKDADLIGIPKHLVIGERGLKEGVVELKDRKTKESEKLSPEDALNRLKEWKKSI